MHVNSKRETTILFVTIIIVYILAVAGYGMWSYQTCRADLLQQIDEKLLIGARGIKYILPPDYHDRAIGRSSISREENMKIARSLTRFRDETGFTYVYTIISVEGELYFAASDISPEDERFLYFEPYRGVADAYKTAFDSKKPVYSTITDRWGTFRSVMVPETSPGGKKYLAVADYKISYVTNQLREKLIYTIFSAMFFLLLPLPVLYLYINSYRQQMKRIESKNRQLEEEISQREKTEGALRKREEQLELALRSADLGMWDWDLKEDSLMVLDQWANIFGRSFVDSEPMAWDTLMTHSPWDDRMHPEDVVKMHTIIKAHMDGQISVYRMEYQFRNSNDEWLWILDIGRVVEWDESGKAIRIVGIYMDITSQKEAEAKKLRLETKMQQTQKLESLGIMAGGIAHDFNNILMSILGYTEIILEDLEEESPLRPGLLEVENGAKRAAELVRQMLAYSGKGKYMVELLDLNSMITDMADMLEASISKKATLNFNLAELLPPLKGDTAQLSQVVMNLVSNASEAFGERSGEISISTTSIKCSLDDLKNYEGAEDLHPGDYILLEISDTGIGMDQETRQKIFDPFFTTKFLGRGLGLAVVQGIVRGHGGACRCCSETNKGTTFQVVLPPAHVTNNAAKKEQIALPENWHGEGTVLLVDDESGVLTVGRIILERAGFDVLTAVNGREAIEVFLKHTDKIACVLLDLSMPEMDGEETFNEMRKIKDDVCVLLSSGFDEQDVVERLADKGIAGFIQKPYRQEELKKKLMLVLGEQD